MLIKLAVALLLCLWVLGARGDVQNITVDDSDGDPSGFSILTYSPNDENYWVDSNGCTECLDETWHNSGGLTSKNAARGFTLQFYGTAVYIFCAVDQPTAWTNLTISLDNGAQSATFTNAGYNSSLQYNIPVYSVDGLDDGEHSVEVTSIVPTIDDDGTNQLLFDYALFTTNTSTAKVIAASSESTFLSSSLSSLGTSATDSPSVTNETSTPQESHVGRNIGIAVGVSLSLIAVICAFFLWWRKRYRAQLAVTSADECATIDILGPAKKEDEPTPSPQTPGSSLDVEQQLAVPHPLAARPFRLYPTRSVALRAAAGNEKWAIDDDDISSGYYTDCYTHTGNRSNTYFTGTSFMHSDVPPTYVSNAGRSNRTRTRPFRLGPSLLAPPAQ